MVNSLPKNPSQSGSHFDVKRQDYSRYAPATFDQRLIACMLDVFIVGACVMVLDFVFRFFSGPQILVPLLGTLLHLFYVVYSQVIYNRTIGKHLLGLRVIRSDGQPTLSFQQMYKRETWGRLAGTVTLGAGYLSILFREDQSGWHDRIGNTQVVSLKTTFISRSMMFARAAGALSVLSMVLAAALSYTIVQTTYPLDSVQARLYIIGVRMSGLSGSLSQGLHISKLDWESEKEFLRLQDISIKFSDVGIFGLSKPTLIKELKVSRAQIRYDADELSGESLISKYFVSTFLLGFATGDVQVKSAEVTNIEVEWGEAKHQIQRLTLSDLTPESAAFRARHISVEHNRYSAVGTDVSYDRLTDEVEGTFEVLAQPALVGPRLKTPIDVKMKVSGALLNPWGSAELIQNKIRLHRSPSGTEVVLDEWSPQQMLKSAFPLNRLNLKFTGKGGLQTLLLSGRVEGSLYLQHSRFVALPEQTLLSILSHGFYLQHENDSYQNRMVLRFQQASEDHARPGPWVQMISTQQLPSLQEELSYLYFQQASVALDPAQRQQLYSDMVFFHEPLLQSFTQPLRLPASTVPDKSPTTQSPLSE